MKTRHLLATLAAVSAMQAVPAHAADFMFEFSGPGIFGPLNGSGIFSVDTDNPIEFRSRTAYDITGITGEFNGSQITGLLPGFLGATNYYYLDQPFLDGSGVSFTVADGKSVNFFNQSSGGRYRINVAPFDTGFVEASSTPVQGAVPEPATWALLLLGFGAIGSATRKGRRGTNVSVAYT